MNKTVNLMVLGALNLVAASGFAACSSDTETSDPNGTAGSGGVFIDAGADTSVGGTGGSGPSDAAVVPKDTSWFDGNWDGYWATCEGGLPPPGGSPECPLDLNMPGCPCTPEGTTAPCFTGARENRNRGICHDGVTKCIRYGEISTIWGACEGEVLPNPAATAGMEACRCFSKGYWKIENVKPCIWGLEPIGSEGAMSTIPVGTDFKCDYAAKPMASPPVLPKASWSKNWLTIDCAGYMHLCYELKAGDAKNPQASDCTLAKVCTEGPYSTPGQAQQMPDLPAWTTNDTVCAQKFFEVGGYGEMTVVAGLSVECDTIPGQLFQTITYCPPKCALDQNKGLPECTNCKNGGGGPFGG
jgi:hypothetical protein